jgi:hypothetical protein
MLRDVLVSAVTRSLLVMDQLLQPSLPQDVHSNQFNWMQLELRVVQQLIHMPGQGQMALHRVFSLLKS